MQIMANSWLNLLLWLSTDITSQVLDEQFLEANQPK